MSEQDYITHQNEEIRVFKESRNPNLPAFLRQTPEQIQAEHKRQSILRDAHKKGVKLSTDEKQIAHAAAAEMAIRRNLQQIDPQSDAYVETVRQLAEVLSEQGKFDEAAQLDVPEHDRYQALAHAVNRDDSEACDCTETVSIGSRNARGESVQKTVEIPTAFVAGNVFSEKHGGIVPIVQCAKCGDINVGGTPPVIDMSDVEKR